MAKKHDIYSLREWAPLTDITDNIPNRIQKGLFPADLGITCADGVPGFIALGSDAGIVFWYNRQSGQVLKLRSETSAAITCVKIVSSVENMVAAGNANGQVSIFQIQRELPLDLDLIAPFTKVRPVERYTIRDLHRQLVTCCEWSKNGMKLFSGDKQGVIVLTEFDYQNHLSKSIEILNEAYEIKQLSVHQSRLLVSTVYRSIICQKNQKTNQWQISQVGKKDRKDLVDVGGIILRKDSKLQIICGRPGLRLWVADIEGNVEKTLLFKDPLSKLNSVYEIPILNPGRCSDNSVKNFRTIHMYLNKYVVTHDGSVLYILNLDQLKVEAIATGFRRIIDFFILDKEIFVLEGPRSLIRLASAPEAPSTSAMIIFNPLLPPPVPNVPNNLIESPVEYEAEDEVIVNAEECFELPPVEKLDSDIVIELAVESPRAEQSRRLEIFNQIGEKAFDESILHHRGGNSTKKDDKTKKKNKIKAEGVVEIGQMACGTSGTSDQARSMKSEEPNTLEFTTKPTLMDASFCTNISFTSFPSTSTFSPSLETTTEPVHSKSDLVHSQEHPLEKEETALGERINLESHDCSEDQHSQPEDTSLNKPTTSQYALNKSVDVEVQTTPQKKSHVLEDLDTLDKENCIKLNRILQFTPTQPITDITPTATIPSVVKMPENMRVPTLWNLPIEKANPNYCPEPASSHTSSEWEFLDN